LVVDDREAVREVLREQLTELGHRVYEAGDGQEALHLLRRCPIDLIVSDVRMPNLDGLGLARRIGRGHPPIVLFSAHGDVPTAVEAMRVGAVDFIEMPIAPEELARRIDQHLAPVPKPGEICLVGTHPMTAELRDRIERVAQRDVSVLITGESGVGKELVAREVHRKSRRAKGPFIAVNCGALPEGLLESELFGHERGSFTGATSRRVGRFERAQGGTLCLDEIGDAPPSIQVKLLRVLESREFERLGGLRTLSADVRIVAATNQDLHELRTQGRFRDDLFHRLNVFPIHVPPLRDRRADIPVLIETLCRRQGLELTWRQASLERMEGHNWPGNVRELLNVLERLAILCDDDSSVSIERVERALDEHSAPVASPRAFFQKEERSALEQLLVAHRYNVSAVARHLDVSRGALRHRLRKYGLL
jgi:DNA-binding NtrC family response regulator